MSAKSKMGWLAVLLLISPFLAYGLSSFIPQYDGFIVTSGSMEPSIQTGALLFTRAVPAENVAVGDAITFTSGSVTTTHEVIQKNSSNGEITFKTQGTANDSPDPGVVTEDQLIGKKMFSVPYLGYIARWASTTTGFILLILIPGTLLVLSELRTILEETVNG